MRILLFLLLTTVSLAQVKENDIIQVGDQVYTNQGGEQLVNVKKNWPFTKVISVEPGKTYKWTANSSNPDTARFFDTGIEELEFELVARRKIKPIIAIRITAVTYLTIERAKKNPDDQEKTICCVTALDKDRMTKLTYDTLSTGVRRNVIINYARGDAGNGKITLTFTKNGQSVSHTYQLPQTAQTGDRRWDIYKDAVFPIDPNQSGQLTISTDQFGAWNLSHIEFTK